MNDKQLLMIPGPTPVPTRVLHALSNPALGHRTPGFSAKIKECTAKVKEILRYEKRLIPPHLLRFRCDGSSCRQFYQSWRQGSCHGKR